MWLFYALLAPLLFAVVHVLDSYCVDEILEKPWMGVTTSAIASCTVFLIAPLILPFIEWEMPSLHLICIGILAGALIQISQIFYFRALANTEAGIVAAYWNLIPMLLPIASFILFREVFSMNQYVGIGILIIASTWMCLLDYYFKTRLNTFLLMLSASALQVASYLFMDVLYSSMHYFIGFLIITTGIIISGVIPLGFSNVRKVFRKNWHRIHPSLGIFFFIEIINLFALAAAQMSISLGNPSLVAAVETTMPAYTFLISALLISTTGNRKKYGDLIAWHHFPWKIVNIGLMAVGVWLLS